MIDDSESNPQLASPQKLNHTIYAKQIDIPCVVQGIPAIQNLTPKHERTLFEKGSVESTKKKSIRKPKKIDAAGFVLDAHLKKEGQQALQNGQHTAHSSGHTSKINLQTKSNSRIRQAGKSAHRGVKGSMQVPIYQTDSQPASRQSNRYGTQSRHRRIRIDHSQNRIGGQRQPSAGFSRTPKQGDQSRIQQTFRPNAAIIQQRLELGGDHQETNMQYYGVKINYPEIKGAQYEAKREKPIEQKQGTCIDTTSNSRYSTLQQKNISAAEKNIFGPMQNGQARGLPGADLGDSSPGRMRENRNTSMMSNTSRRPFGAAENKRIQRNDPKKLQSQQAEERSPIQLNDILAKPTNTSSQPVAATHYYMDQQREVASCPKFQKLSIQNNCATEDISRVNSNDRQKFSIQLGCTSLNMTESNNGSAQKPVETKLDSNENHHTSNITLLKKEIIQAQQKYNQLHPPPPSNNQKDCQTPIELLYQSTGQAKSPFKQSKSIIDNVTPDHNNQESNESKSALESNSGLQLSRAATLKQNISQTSDRKPSHIKFTGSVSGNGSELPHNRSRDKFKLPNHQQNKFPYFFTGTGAGAGQKNQTTNIKIQSQDISSDPNDQIMSLYQELAKNNPITNDQLQKKGSLPTDQRMQKEMQPPDSQSPYPQNIFQNANLATMCSGNSRASNHILNHKMRNQQNSRVQRQQQVGKQAAFQQSQHLKGQRNSYLKSNEAEIKSSRTSLPKRQNHSVVARRPENQVQAPPIFEQNVANMIQNQLLQQGEQQIHTSKHDSNGYQQIHIEAFNSNNSRTLLPGAINNDIHKQSSFSRGRLSNNRIIDGSKTMPKKTNIFLQKPNTISKNNLSQLNKQINQMVNSETFKKIFKEIENSRELSSDSLKNTDHQIDFDALMNQLTNSASAERTELSGCPSMTSDKSLGTGPASREQIDEKNHLIPFKSSSVAGATTNQKGNLNINLDAVCALTGYTNSDLINLISNDFHPERKIADRIIANSNLITTKLINRDMSFQDLDGQGQTIKQKDHTSLTRNIDILSTAAGMVSGSNFQRDGTSKDELRDQYSNSLIKQKGTYFLQSSVYCNNKQRQRNSDLCNSQGSLLGQKNEGMQSKKDGQASSSNLAADSLNKRSNLDIDEQNSIDGGKNEKNHVYQAINSQNSKKQLPFHSRHADPILPASLTPAPLLNIDNSTPGGLKLGYSSPIRNRQECQSNEMHYSPSIKQQRTQKDAASTPFSAQKSMNASQIQKMVRHQAMSRETTATVATMGPGPGRNSIILTNRQIMLEKMGRQQPPVAVGASDLAIHYNGVPGQSAARGGTFQIVGGKNAAPPPFMGKEYADDGTIILTGSQGKLAAYHHAQTVMKNGVPNGPFSGHYGQQSSGQPASNGDTVWNRQAHSGDRITSPYSRSNRIKFLGNNKIGERQYSKEQVNWNNRGSGLYDAHLTNRTPNAPVTNQVQTSNQNKSYRGKKSQFNSANSTLNKQQNQKYPPPGKQQSHSMSGRQQNRYQQQQQNQKPAQAEKTPDEFDIEYAKLIARQFPIHDAQGNVIDYSNINEYQLELLALHEEYGEETDFEARRRIFEKLSSMNEEEFYKNKAKAKGASQNNSSTSASTTNEQQQKKNNKRPYGLNVGKDGGNPEYKKTVIQLEKERLEREKQELILKRKRNSNYIQQCIRHGNEHYDQQRLNSLAWLRKESKRDEDHDNDPRLPNSHIDDKNLEILRRKQEIIKKYNKMSKENGQGQPEEGMYRYSLIRGNNSNLIKRVLDTREHLVELDQPHLTLYSFKWAPVSRYINYEQLGLHGQKKVVNHLECHGLLTMKDQLYINMHRYCEQNKLNVFQYMPVQFILDISSKSFISEVDRFCQYFNIIEKMRVKSQKQGNSDAEALTIEDYNHQLQKINEQIIQNKNIQSELKYKNFVSRKFTMFNEMYRGRNVWLIKPNDFNRGRGVRLFNSLEQLRKLMKEFSLGNEMDFYMHNACCQILANEKQLGNLQSLQARLEESEKNEQPQSPKLSHSATKNTSSTFAHQQQPYQSNDTGNSSAVQLPGTGPNLSANVKSEVFVIQKYIERPLLIDGRKFDIRLWVLINCCDLSNQKCYLFREGYIRTSSYTFSLNQEQIDQPFVHLTNNAVQQHDQNYGKLEEGNQLSFTQGQQILKSQTGLDVDFHKIYNNEILEIILMSLKSVACGRLNPNYKKHTFEIMGYDFMIDEQLRPWLIEVNTNPCLEETSELLRQLLPRMIDDAFKLTLDVYLPPKSNAQASGPDGTPKQQSKQHFKVDGYDDQENLWRHIYTLKNDR